MESLEECDLWQMVNDFIETESASPSYSASSGQNASLLSQRTRSFQLQEILKNKRSTDEEGRVLEIVRTHMRNNMEVKKSSKLKRWMMMCLRRNGFDASLCRTRWPSSSSCPAGEYEFVDVIVGPDDDHQQKRRLIVDVDFKSQFEVARPTKCYSELCSNLPQIFVGSEEKVRKVIRLMCSAAEESMRQRGLHVPPWRRSAYMLSKWVSDFTSSREGEREDEIDDDEKLMIDCVKSKSSESPPPALMMVFAMKKKKKIDRRSRQIAAAGSGGLAGYFSNLSINCC